MTLKKLTIEQDQEVLKYYYDGLTISEIAEIFNVSTNPIKRILVKNKVKTRKNSDYDYWTILSPEQENEIINLYQENFSANEIAKKFDINNTRVLRILKRKKIKIKEPSSYIKKLHESQDEAILSLYSQGFSINEVGKKFGVEASVINNILVKHDIYKRGAGSYNHKFTEEQENEVIDLYVNQKMFVTEIAIKFQVEGRTISKILKSHNIKILTSKDMRKFTPEQEQEIINLYWRGYNTYQLAEKFDISRTSVKRIFIRNNVETLGLKMTEANIKRKIPKSKYPKIISLYNSGLTQSKIGELYDVTEETIRKILQANNVATRKKYAQKINEKQCAEIVKLYQQDVSTIKLAKQFNVQKSTIQKILEKNKIDIKGAKYFNKKITLEQEAEIMDYYNKGFSISKTSQLVNVNRSTIKLVLDRNNIETRDSTIYQIKITPEVEKEIIDLYKEIQNLKVISEKFNLSPQTISKAFKKAGVEVKNAYSHLKKLTDDDKNKIFELYQTGLNMNQISKMLNFSPATVSKILKKIVQ